MDAAHSITNGEVVFGRANREAADLIKVIILYSPAGQVVERGNNTQGMLPL